MNRPAKIVGTPLQPWATPPPALSLAGLPIDGDLPRAQHHYLRSVQDFEDLIATVSVFDRRSFDAQPRTSSPVLAALSARLREPGPVVCRDLLLRLAESATDALRKIAANPRVRMNRTYEQMLPAKVRIQDTHCLMRLARVPGRTLREKTSVARKVPAVVRYRSVDTAENRLAKRVALEFGGAARARLEQHRTHDALPSTGVERLKSLLAACRLFENDDFCDLPPSVRAEPNNTLLAHPDYNRIWLAFRQVRQREALFGSLWRNTHAWTPILATWAVESLIAGAESVWSTEAIVGTSFKDQTHPFSVQHGSVQFVVAPREREPRVVTVRSGKDHISVEIAALVGVQTLRSSYRQTFTFAFEVPDHIPQSWEADRGMPLEVFGYHDASDQLDVWEGASDRVGLRDLAQWICERTGLPVEPRRRLDEPFHPMECAGVDLFAPAVVVASARSANLVDEPALAASPSGEASDFSAPTVLGSAAGLAVAGEWSITAVDDLMNGLGVDQQDSGQLRTGRDIVSHVLGDSTDRSTELAFATPDDLDEVGMRSLRSLLPAKSWLVWRSVAAAMAWRQTVGTEALSDGDSVLVIDAGTWTCLPTLLIGRTEPEGSGDRWYWERRNIFEGLPTSLGAPDLRDTMSKLSELVCGAWAGIPGTAATRRRLEHDSRFFGHLRTMGEGTIRVPCVDEDGHLALAAAEISRESLAQLARHVEAQYRAWLGAFVESRAVADLHRHVGTGRLHVLLSGAPFGLQIATALRNAVHEHFPNAEVHVPDDTATVAARGCAVFVERHRAGLPTWRDIIPDLALMVATSAGEKRVALLDKSQLAKGVRPGQVLRHQSPETFQLPAHVNHLDLPLASGEAEGRRREMHTVVEHDSLPLSKPVEVRLHVHYRYAEDSFRVFLRPVGDAPFAEIEVTWSRGAVTGGGPKVRNLAPRYPAAIGWEDAGPLAAESDALLKQLGTKFQVFEKKNKSKMFQRIKADPRAVVAELKDLTRVVDDAATLLAGLVPRTRRIDEVPADVRIRLARFAELLSPLAGLPRLTHSGRNPTKQRGSGSTRERIWGIEKLLQEAKSLAGRPIDDLESSAFTALSRLRSFAPFGGVDFLQAAVDAGGAGSDVFEPLGRMLGSPVGADRAGSYSRLLVEAREFLESGSTRGDKLPGVRHRLWAIGTALWTSEGAVIALTSEQALLLLQICQTVGQRLDGEWRNERIAIELFHEWGLVLLALLRRRNLDDPASDFLHAEGAASRDLADLTERIDHELRQRGDVRAPRIGFETLDTDTTRSSFAALVADTLRGHRVALIQLKED